MALIKISSIPYFEASSFTILGFGLSRTPPTISFSDLVAKTFLTSSCDFICMGKTMGACALGIGLSLGTEKVMDMCIVALNSCELHCKKYVRAFHGSTDIPTINLTPSRKNKPASRGPASAAFENWHGWMVNAIEILRRASWAGRRIQNGAG